MNENAFDGTLVSVAQSAPVERGRFIRRTYAHLAGAILAFIVLETLLLSAPFAKALIGLMVGDKISMLVVMGLFMGSTWLAQSWAQSGTSSALQYLGMSLCVVAYAIFFMPILYVASVYYPGVIPSAAILTLGLFLGLTGVVVLTRVDFSFLGSMLAIGGFIAFGVIVASIIFGFTLGTLFSGIMVLFAAAAILYQTSGILNTHRTDQYVGAALTLFASIALMFMYILRLLMGRR